MKSILISYCLLFTITCVSGQTVFKKMYGQFSPDNFELKEIFNSNNFILSNHNSISSRHTFFKIDETGQPYNQNYIYQPIGGSTSGSHKFYFRNDSVYDLVGKHFTPGSYPSLIFIARYDSSLQNMILSRFYDVRTSSPPGIISWRNFDSSYSLAGGYAISPGQYYPMMFKLDTGLNVNWSQSYRDRVGYVQDMVQAPDDGYFLLMHLVNEGMTLTKTDSTGTIIWSKNYSSPFRKAQRMLLLKDSTLLLLGYMNETLLPNNITTTTPCIIKTNEMGDILWSKKYDNPANPFIIAAINPIVNFDTAYQNKFVLTGSVINSNPAADMLLMLIDELGNPLWARKYGNNYFAELGSVCHQTSDGGFIVGGFNNYQINNFPPVFNQANITVIKTDSLGISDGCMEYPVTIYSEPDIPLVTNLTWSIYVDSIVTEIPSDMVDTTGTPTRNEDMCTFVSLLELPDKEPDFEIFPNPNSGDFQIKFNKITNNKIMRVDILDLMGRIAFSYNENSVNQISLSIPNIAPGMYVINVTADETVFTKKMVIE